MMFWTLLINQWYTMRICHAWSSMFLSACKHFTKNPKKYFKKQEGEDELHLYISDLQCVRGFITQNHDERASSAHARDDALSSDDTDVSILASSVAQSSCMDGRLVGSGWIQRLTTSHKILRSSYLKCFNSGSTTYDIASGRSR